jgi:hypothetical protein
MSRWAAAARLVVTVVEAENKPSDYLEWTSGKADDIESFIANLPRIQILRRNVCTPD